MTTQQGSIPNGSLRVWSVINPPRRATYYPVTTPKEAKGVISHLIQEQLKHTTIWANAFGLEVREETGWHEWYDEEGNDINHLLDNKEERKGR